MTYNPQIHHRRSIRLKGYDYSKKGFYFITMCVQKRKNLFGKFDSVGAALGGCPNMMLNDAGIMVERWYRELENKYPDKQCHQMIIMPNHIHYIIENLNVGIQIDQMDGMDGMDAHVGAPPHGRPLIKHQTNINDNDSKNEKYGFQNIKYNATIGDLVDWFKTMTTNEYIRGVKQFDWPRFDGKLWQRNYYEHIIRSTGELNRIANYIINNPAKWHNDKFRN